MPKWIDKTSFAQSFSETQGSKMFWAMKGPDPSTDVIAIISFSEENGHSLITINNPIEGAIIHLEALDRTLSETFAVAENVLIELGYAIPEDEVSIEWSN